MTTRTTSKSKASHATDRKTIRDFRRIINVGAATAEDFRRIGVANPQQLIGKDPLALYQKICRRDGQFHDPCVLDVFMASVDYMNGNPPKKWWDFTSKRKSAYAAEVEKLRSKYPR